MSAIPDFDENELRIVRNTVNERYAKESRTANGRQRGQSGSPIGKTLMVPSCLLGGDGNQLCRLKNW